MSVPKALLVSLAMVAAGSALRRVPPKDMHQTRNWPCPENVDIEPCLCESDEYLNLYMDCSDAISHIELERVFQANFPFYDFLQLTILQDPLDVHRNITDLTEKIFGSVSFERIHISGTKLADIHEQALADSHESLQYLNLANNQLNAFPFETIPSFTSLDSLLLDNNNFTALYELESESLRTLSVSGNSKLQFDVDVFHKAPGLRAVFMARIDLFELPAGLFSTLQNIQTISLEDNFLGTLLENSFNPPSNTIKQLIINGNLIETVIHDAIHGMHPSGFISLVRNKIEKLDSDVWTPIFDSVVNGTINLTGNPLICGCDLAWIMLDETDVYLPIISESSTCGDGTVVHSLDKEYFEMHCTHRF